MYAAEFTSERRKCTRLHPCHTQNRGVWRVPRTPLTPGTIMNQHEYRLATPLSVLPYFSGNIFLIWVIPYAKPTDTQGIVYKTGHLSLFSVSFFGRYFHHFILETLLKKIIINSFLYKNMRIK
jgi:hypothetical protein